MTLKSENKWLALAWCAIAVIMPLTTWFSATAIAPELSTEFNLTSGQQAWLINAVQIGFVAGALTSSLFLLADIWPSLRVMALASLAGGAANLLIVTAPGIDFLLAARFATGVALAMIYPVALKFISTWFRTGRGLAMGTMVGALTLGSAVPHYLRTLDGETDWKLVIFLSSAACVVAALIFEFILREGPHEFPRMKVDLKQFGAIFRNRSVMLANLGYFGHMWELYAMWGWILAYAAAAKASGVELGNVSVLAFAVIALGSPSCILAGWLADRIGRSATTIIAMTLSGLSALAIGFAFDGPAWLFVLVACFWGFTVVADSAQFSAAVSELADPNYVGSALTFQMSVGFAITMFTVWLVPQLAQWLESWRWTFVILALGPLVGVSAMLMLRSRPDATNMAGGLR
ncbi:MAG: MFS transporter [Rhizobiaceae bacterium]